MKGSTTTCKHVILLILIAYLKRLFLVEVPGTRKYFYLVIVVFIFKCVNVDDDNDDDDIYIYIYIYI